jgi:hypothetical protein
MRKIIEEIYEDWAPFGSYLATVTTCRVSSVLCEPADDVLPEHLKEPVCIRTGENIHVLDEWDHRRQGYQRWAVLRETGPFETSRLPKKLWPNTGE